MAVTLGRSFNRQFKMRIPYNKYFYDIGIFYTTQINFNVFDIKPIFKHGSMPADNVVINMFKNIETSKFCTKFLQTQQVDGRPSRFLEIRPEYSDVIYHDFTEQIVMTSSNMMSIRLFTMNDFVEDFKYVLVERKNIPKTGEKVISTLTGLQIASTSSIKKIENF